MRIRSSFVSNSSSSSFIVINRMDVDWDENDNEDYSNYIKQFTDFIKQYGNIIENKVIYTPVSSFGWEFEIHNSLLKKFDWVCYFYDEKTNKEVMDSFISKYLDIPNVKFIINKDYPQIDHQSITKSNGRMLENLESLEDFIFSDRSVIYGGNDNNRYKWNGVRNLALIDNPEDYDYYGLNDYIPHHLNNERWYVKEFSHLGIESYQNYHLEEDTDKFFFELTKFLATKPMFIGFRKKDNDNYDADNVQIYTYKSIVSVNKCPEGEDIVVTTSDGKSHQIIIDSVIRDCVRKNPFFHKGIENIEEEITQFFISLMMPNYEPERTIEEKEYFTCVFDEVVY